MFKMFHVKKMVTIVELQSSQSPNTATLQLKQLAFQGSTLNADLANSQEQGKEKESIIVGQVMIFMGFKLTIKVESSVDLEDTWK